ncbi:ABC transporter permease [Roseomonas terrae]|jgi:lipoprotein-releasing system permease protein|uniref:ABC transporter permease n=1 Tax=Neoroseomonas terrae TaxID=424799 RepID=A0ABS5EAP6_9PROT|nr:ABC transporter permease [Neoroseomonas terrae]MBR0648097.1 ABC transporter permease [Neoroseomonas terrae]
MKLILDLARGMLSRRRRQTLVSVLGVALGVAFFIAIAAMMSGFQTYFVQQVIDVQPHIVIKDETRSPTPQAAQMAMPDGAVQINGVKPVDRVRGIRAAGDKLAIIEAIPGAAAAPILTGTALLRYGSRDVSVSVTGIDPVRYARVANIGKDMLHGRLDDLRSTANGLIIGDALALRLGVEMGDTVVAVSPRGVSLQMKIVGIFHTGIATLDQGAGYMLLKVNQVLQDRPNVINQIQLRLADVTQAEPLARELESRFGDRTESWEEQNRNILTVFVIQNAIMYSVTGAILLVASFGIYNIISTVVFEKTRDIAILKSLGFTEGDVQRLFLVQGLIAGFLGAVLGCLIGQLMIEGLAQVRFQTATPAGNDRFLLARDWRIYVIASFFAIASAALAALIPARRAARLDPVQIVRGAA